MQKVIVSFSISHRDKKRLEKLAKSKGMKKSEFIRKLLNMPESVFDIIPSNIESYFQK